jgi:alcohol dehydrogenase YqhD (iron-dependent ADH family)
MALNGLIQKGVPSDWATHMIGHELTALYGIDHARTLAIIGPNLYQVLFETKKEKLAQYGKRIFNLTGSDEEIAAAAIKKTTAFFHVMGMQTKLSDDENYGLALETTNKLIPGETMCGHTGSAYGLYSAMFFNVKKKFGIVVICNGCGSTYDSGFNTVIKKAVNNLYDAFIK